MAIKPVVDGLEHEFEGRLDVVRVALHSPAGREAAGRWGLDVVPLALVLDAAGAERGRLAGTAVTPAALRALVAAAAG